MNHTRYDLGEIVFYNGRKAKICRDRMNGMCDVDYIDDNGNLVGMTESCIYWEELDGTK